MMYVTLHAKYDTDATALARVRQNPDSEYVTLSHRQDANARRRAKLIGGDYWVSATYRGNGRVVTLPVVYE